MVQLEFFLVLLIFVMALVKLVHFLINYWCHNFRLSFTMFPTSCRNQYSDVLFSQNYYNGWFFWSNSSHLDVSWSGKCKFFVYFYRFISSWKDWKKKIIISKFIRCMWSLGDLGSWVPTGWYQHTKCDNYRK